MVKEEVRDLDQVSGRLVRFGWVRALLFVVVTAAMLVGQGTATSGATQATLPRLTVVEIPNSLSLGLPFPNDFTCRLTYNDPFHLDGAVENRDADHCVGFLEPTQYGEKYFPPFFGGGAQLTVKPGTPDDEVSIIGKGAAVTDSDGFILGDNWDSRIVVGRTQSYLIGVDASPGTPWEINLDQVVSGVFALKHELEGDYGDQHDGSAGVGTFVVGIFDSSTKVLLGSFSPAVTPRSFSADVSDGSEKRAFFTGTRSDDAVFAGTGQKTFIATLDFSLKAFSNDGCNLEKVLGASIPFTCGTNAGGEESAAVMGLNDVIPATTRNNPVTVDTPQVVPVKPGWFINFTLNALNSAPVADSDAYNATEDTQLVVQASGVLDGDTDVEGDGLSAVLNVDVSHGTLALNANGSFTYDPDANYCGPDSFTYHANDGTLDSNIATVTISVTCVNDPPVITGVSPSSQTVAYSDHIVQVTISATDVDSDPMTLSQAGAPSALPDRTLASTRSCVTITNASIMDGASCTWTLDGQVLDPGDNVHNIEFTTNDGSLSSAANPPTTRHVLTVEPENATLSFDAANPVSVQVHTSGGDSPPFTLRMAIVETEPDVANGTPQFGDLNNAQVFVTLRPVAQGASITVTCTHAAPLPVYPGDGYDQELFVDCDFDNIPVNTYAAEAVVGGFTSTTGFYSGFGEDVLTVFDPSLGFATGGGFFYWPGTNDRTNFGFNVKYNKQGTRVQGGLLLIRHLNDGTIYRVKSNAMDGLAIGEDPGPPAYGWASFSGKATYREPGWSDPVGNYRFTTYVEDLGEPGSHGAAPDRFWIEVRDKDGVVLGISSLTQPGDANAEDLAGGNIQVPHGTEN
jgi:VCBS repeat-containing protein